MNWRWKAAIQRACNAMPCGKHALYYQLQRYCGGLVRGYDHRFLLGETARMVSMLRNAGFDLEGATVMEVGTGWRLDMPLALYLCGARRVITCDLNRYLVGNLALDTVRYVPEQAAAIRDMFGFVGAKLERRIANLQRVTTLDELFGVTGIEYHAPLDCAATPFADRSIDLHYSYTVFEHIPAATLEAILREASRLLSARGLTFHHIDLGDHFAQVDSSITPANFLRFSQQEWDVYASTPWSYHNRLREDDYRELFERASHDVLYWKPHIDQRSLESLESGFPIAENYRHKPVEMLSVAILDVISRAAG